jgi:hypothetical protein
MAQGASDRSNESDKRKKISYTSTATVKDKDKEEIYSLINQWAKKTYAKDYFVSSISSNKSSGTISINSKIELLLTEKDSTVLKYKLRITCSDEKYSIKVSDLSYQYDPLNKKRFKSYPAEDIISQQGENNKVTIIKNPKLFYKATYSYIQTLFDEISQSVFKD